MSRPLAPPFNAGFDFTDRSDHGVPLMHWGDLEFLWYRGYAAALATYEIIQDGAVLRSGTFFEQLVGRYSTPIDRKGEHHTHQVCDDQVTQIGETN